VGRRSTTFIRGGGKKGKRGQGQEEVRTIPAISKAAKRGSSTSIERTRNSKQNSRKTKNEEHDQWECSKAFKKKEGEEESASPTTVRDGATRSHKQGSRTLWRGRKTATLVTLQKEKESSQKRIYGGERILLPLKNISSIGADLDPILLNPERKE